MNLRRRVTALAVVVVVSLVGSGAYLWSQRAERQTALRTAQPVDTVNLTDVQAGPRIVFRSTALGSTYGRVAAVALSNPGGPRAFTSTECERVYAAARRVLCLAADRGLVTRYSAMVLDDGYRPIRPLKLTGVASRARLSRDGSLTATTAFTTGSSYASSFFSTQTIVSRVDGSSSDDIENFTLVHKGKAIRPVDRNIWGVTFADNNTFYATVAWASQTWLAKGDLSQRRLDTIRPDAECPSLSPDRTRVVYKKRLGQPAGRWRLASLDIASGKETLLGETRSIDDQVEWLDNRSVIYGLPRLGAQAAVSDVWVVPVDGRGGPKRLIEGAWSPAVVR